MNLKKIQYGIAGFFSGLFIGLLIGLVEMRIIKSSNHYAELFFVMAFTVIVCSIAGMLKGMKLAGK